MKIKHLFVPALLSVLVATTTFAASWSVRDRIHIGGNSFWDYLTVEPVSGRLFIAHAKQVEVVDLKRKTVVGTIPGRGWLHGVALVPELKKGFFTDGGAGTVFIFDLQTLKVTGTATAGQNPDAICFEPVTKKVFAFNGKSSNVTVLDAALGKLVGDIKLEGKLEFAVADGRGFVYDAVEDKDLVVKIDAKTLEVVAKWNLPQGSEPTGMAIDEKRGHLFVGCSGSYKMLVLDSGAGKVLATLPIGGSVDACAYDPVHKQVFASCGEGMMTVVRQGEKDDYTVVENVPTARGSRTMAFDPATGTAYLPAVKMAAAPTEGGAAPKQTAQPDSFEVLVVGSK